MATVNSTQEPRGFDVVRFIVVAGVVIGAFALIGLKFFQ